MEHNTHVQLVSKKGMFRISLFTNTCKKGVTGCYDFFSLLVTCVTLYEKCYEH